MSYKHMARLLYNMEFLLLFFPAFLVTIIQAQTDPTNIVCTAVNSTVLRLTWTQATDASVIGYFLGVERVDGLKVEPAIPTKDLDNRIYDNHDTSGLGKYGTYDITLFSYTAAANLTQYVTTCTTSEDVPDSSSQNFSCESYSGSAIRCSWSALEQVYWNGIQQGYRLQYMKTESVSQLYSTTVDNSTTTTLLSGLQYGTMYTILLNAYTSVGDGIAYVTTNAATQGYNDGPLEENVTRYYCNEALPGMIEFGWEEMPCTIYSGTIGALLIVCILFISIFACQACCQSKGGGGTNELSINLFQDNPRSRGGRFNDDDSETDDQEEDEKRNLDDDEYNDDEEYDNEGYSPDRDHKYDDRYTATPDVEKKTPIPDDERYTATPGDDRNTATPGTNRNTATPGDGAHSSMSTNEDQHNAASSNRASRNNVHRNQIVTARDVELDNINEENELSDNVFSDSDYDSQSDIDFLEENHIPNNEGVSSKPLPIVISKQTAVNNKKPNTTKQVKKSQELMSNQRLKEEDITGHKPVIGKKNTTKTTADVHNSDITGNGQIHNQNQVQTKNSERFKCGQETAATGSPAAHLSSGPNVRINGNTLDETDEWGSPSFDAHVNQTNKKSTTSEDNLSIQDNKQKNIGTSNNDLHEKGKLWEEGSGWGESSNKASESHKATAPRRFNIGLNKQNNTTINTTWDEGQDWGDVSNKTNETNLGTNAKPISARRKEQHRPRIGNSEWDEDDDWGNSYSQSSENQIQTSARMLVTPTKGQSLMNAKKTNPAPIYMTNETQTNKNNIQSGWASPLSTSRTDNTVNSNKTNIVKTSESDDWAANNSTKILKHTDKRAFGKQRNIPAEPNSDSKLNMSSTLGKQPNKTSHILHETANGQPIHGSSNFITEEFAGNSGQANSDRPVRQKVHPQSKGQSSVALSKFSESKVDKGNYDHPNLNTEQFGNKLNKNKNHSQANNVNRRNNGSDQSLKNGEMNQHTDINPRPQKNRNNSSHAKQKPNTSTVEYKNMFYMEDEIENVQSSVDTKDQPELQRPKSKQNGKMIPTKAWQPQIQKQSIKSGRKTPVESMPKPQSWTTMEPEPVIETDRLGKKFPFLNVDTSFRAITPSVKRNFSETDVRKYDSAMSELRRTSEPVKSDKMKDTVNAFSETTEKSNKRKLSYGFGVHDRFREVAAAWLAKFRGKKNPVKTVNSEWF